MIQTSYVLNSALFSQAVWAFNRSTARGKAFYYGLPIIILCWLALGILTWSYLGSGSLPFGLLCGSGVLALLRFVYGPIKVRTLFSKTPLLQGEIRLTVSEEGLGFSTSRTESLLKWSSMAGIIETKDLFVCVLLGESNFSLFAKGALSVEEQEKVRALIKRNNLPLH